MVIIAPATKGSVPFRRRRSDSIRAQA